jgi:hypothetical protein
MLDKLRMFLQKLEEFFYWSNLEVRYLSVPIWRPWRDF